MRRESNSWTETAAAARPRSRPARSASHCDDRTMPASDPLHHAPPEQALRHGEQHDENDDEGERILVGRADVACPERLEQAEQEPARHRAERITHAAEPRRAAGSKRRW